MNLAIPVDNELSPQAQALLTNLKSRGGAIRGNIAKDKVMWLYWSARPGEPVLAATFKELQKHGFLEFQMNIRDGEKQYRLADTGLRKK